MMRGLLWGHGWRCVGREAGPHWALQSILGAFWAVLSAIMIANAEITPYPMDQHRLVLRQNDPNVSMGDSIRNTIGEFISSAFKPENNTLKVIIVVVLMAFGVMTTLAGKRTFKPTITIISVCGCMLISLHIANRITAGEKVVRTGNTISTSRWNIPDVTYMALGIGALVGLIISVIAWSMLRIGVVIAGAIAGYFLSTFAIAYFDLEMTETAKVGIQCAAVVAAAAFAFVATTAMKILFSSLFGSLLITLALQFVSGDPSLLNGVVDGVTLGDNSGSSAWAEGGTISKAIRDSDKPLVKYAIFIMIAIFILGVIIQTLTHFSRSRRGKGGYPRRRVSSSVM